jgi:hypothetical protein
MATTHLDTNRRDFNPMGIPAYADTVASIVSIISRAVTSTASLHTTTTLDVARMWHAVAPHATDSGHHAREPKHDTHGRSPADLFLAEATSTLSSLVAEWTPRVGDVVEPMQWSQWSMSVAVAFEAANATLTDKAIRRGVYSDAFAASLLQHLQASRAVLWARATELRAHPWRELCGHSTMGDDSAARLYQQECASAVAVLRLWVLSQGVWESLETEPVLDPDDVEEQEAEGEMSRLTSGPAHPLLRMGLDIAQHNDCSDCVVWVRLLLQPPQQSHVISRDNFNWSAAELEGAAILESVLTVGVAVEERSSARSRLRDAVQEAKDAATAARAAQSMQFTVAMGTMLP